MIYMGNILFIFIAVHLKDGLNVLLGEASDSSSHVSDIFHCCHFVLFMVCVVTRGSYAGQGSNTNTDTSIEIISTDPSTKYYMFDYKELYLASTQIHVL